MLMLCCQHPSVIQRRVHKVGCLRAWLGFVDDIIERLGCVSWNSRKVRQSLRGSISFSWLFTLSGCPRARSTLRGCWNFWISRATAAHFLTSRLLGHESNNFFALRLCILDILVIQIAHNLKSYSSYLVESFLMKHLVAFYLPSQFFCFFFT